MNLGQYLVQQLLEAEQTTIALFPGAFKPPHKGHFAVVKKLLENADQVTVLISIPSFSMIHSLGASCKIAASLNSIPTGSVGMIFKSSG